jgi:hypothetical protein
MAPGWSSMNPGWAWRLFRVSMQCLHGSKTDLHGGSIINLHKSRMSLHMAWGWAFKDPGELARLQGDPPPPQLQWASMAPGWASMASGSAYALQYIGTGIFEKSHNFAELIYLYGIDMHPCKSEISINFAKLLPLSNRIRNEKNIRNKRNFEYTKFRNTLHTAWKRDILWYTNTAQLQCRSFNAVMITADVLTEHFGIHQRCAATPSELWHYNRIIPTLLCLLTQQVGMSSKSTKDDENVHACLVIVSLGASKRAIACNGIHHYGSIDTNFDPPPPLSSPLDSTFKGLMFCSVPND